MGKCTHSYSAYSRHVAAIQHLAGVCVLTVSFNYTRYAVTFLSNSSALRSSQYGTDCTAWPWYYRFSKTILMIRKYQWDSFVTIALESKRRATAGATTAACRYPQNSQYYVAKTHGRFRVCPQVNNIVADIARHVRIVILLDQIA